MRRGCFEKRLFLEKKSVSLAWANSRRHVVNGKYAPFSAIDANRSSAGALLWYRASASLNRSKSVPTVWSPAASFDFSSSCCDANKAAGPAFLVSGFRTVSRNVARNEAGYKSVCRDTAFADETRTPTPASEENSPDMLGSQGCTRLASANAVGLGKETDSRATNKLRALADAAAKLFPPPSAPHATTQVPTHRRYKPTPAKAVSSTVGLLASELLE
jgi:hypothetical protein